MKTIIFLALTALISANAVKWNADTKNAKIAFSVKGPFGTVNGKFGGFKSTIKFSPDDLKSSSFTASLDAKTVSTGIALRNRDLRKKKIWLDAEKYPRITFKSDKIEKNDNGYVAIGDLTIKEKTKQVKLPFTYSRKDNDAVFKGKFTINREDFDVGKKGGSVGKEVTINLTIPVNKD